MASKKIQNLKHNYVYQGCSTGKVTYFNRKAAKDAAKYFNGKSRKTHNRAKMEAYRCDLCGTYHIGHTTGAGMKEYYREHPRPRDTPDAY